MMKKYSIMIILVVLFLVLVAWLFPADAAIWRSSSKDDQRRVRKAVEYIDMGRVKNDGYDLNYFTLVCVDGVKIYTTLSTDGHNVNSFIISGRCDGKPEPQHKLKPKVIYIPNETVPVQVSKEDFLKW